MYKFSLQSLRQTQPGLLAISLLILLSLGGCTRLFFYPMKPHLTDPSKLGYAYEDVFLNAADGTALHGWLIKPKEPTQGYIYFLHGNAENISTHFRATLWLVDAGYEVFALDYRGYGLSQGKPDVPEVLTDIGAGADWLFQYINAQAPQTPQPGMRAFLYGQSLGAGLAINHAQENSNFNQQFNGLITEAAFSRYDSIAKHVASKHWLTWSAQYPAKWLIGNQYDPLDAIRQLAGTPKLLLHSPDDQVVPFRFGQALYAAAAAPKQWIEAQGGHIRAAASADVREQILAFMQRYSHPEIEQARRPSGNRTDP